MEKSNWIHINKPRYLEKIHKPLMEVWKNTKLTDIYLTNCCHCNMESKDIIFDGGYQEWYGWNIQLLCESDKGCNLNPRRKIGMDNRPYPEYNE